MKINYKLGYIQPKLIRRKKKFAQKNKSVWGRYRCLWIAAIIIFPESRPRAEKSKGSRFCFRCLIWMKKNLIWGFFDLLNMMQISDLHQQGSIFTCKISLLWLSGQIFQKNNASPKKIIERQMKKCRFENYMYRSEKIIPILPQLFTKLTFWMQWWGLLWL